MSAILQDGKYKYREVRDWAKLPDGWYLDDVAAVAVDKKDQVYVFNRGNHPMIVFDRAGAPAVRDGKLHEGRPRDVAARLAGSLVGGGVGHR